MAACRSHQYTFRNAKGEPFELQLSFYGPTSSSKKDANTRKSLISQENICPDLSSSQIDTLLKASTSRVCLLQASLYGNYGDAVPDNIVQFLDKKRTPAGVRPRPGAFIGAYIIDTKQPCVLQYICVKPELRSLGLGKYLLRHFEHYVAVFHARTCSYMYLAAVNSPKVVNFYQRSDWTLVNVGAEMENPVLEAGEPILGAVTFKPDEFPAVGLVIYHDTVVMKKGLYDFELPEESSDDSIDAGNQPFSPVLGSDIV